MDTNNELVFVGYTNGHQILYGQKEHGGEGMFYSDTENESYIPLYMLRSHAHRLETTSGMQVKLSDIAAVPQELEK